MTNRIGYGLQAMLNRIWYGKSWLIVLLLPLSMLFALLAAVRRQAYRSGLVRSYNVPVPVAVVGNITVGGAGKTPVAMWLADALKAKGMQPAIISRGYASKAGKSTLRVMADTDPRLVGDEPVLMAQRTACPVFVNRNRVEAAREAVRMGADVIVSDDGLQHYRLCRDVELAVIDGSRGIGNGYLLPAGPLRERESRLDSVDRILIQCEEKGASARYGNRMLDLKTARFSLCGEILQHIDGDKTLALKELANVSVHAVAGIANPERFFRQLERSGLKVIRHPLPDHAAISGSDIHFDDDLAVVITEKDAVKCRAIGHDRLWYLPVDLVFDPEQSLRWVDALHARLLASTSQEQA